MLNFLNSDFNVQTIQRHNIFNVMAILICLKPKRAVAGAKRIDINGKSNCECNNYPFNNFFDSTDTEGLTTTKI